MKRLNRLPLFVLCLLLTPALARAGIVSGTVKDLNTRNPTNNVAVYFKPYSGGTFADTTDANGNYLLNTPNEFGVLHFVPLNGAYWYAKHDSLHANGNVNFNAVMIDTNWTSSDSARANVRVKANEFKDVHLNHINFKGNPWLWNRVDIPYVISDRFPSVDSSNIENAIKWKNANNDTTIFKYVRKNLADSLRSIFFYPGSGNQTGTGVNGDSIYRAVVELATTTPIIVLHEFGYHATSYPSWHVVTYTSNYSDPPNGMPNPKDNVYMNLAYILRKATKDSINNLFLGDYSDSVTVGVDFDPKLVMPIRNNGLILHTPYPNPARDYVNLGYSLDRPRGVDISLFNALGQLLGKARGAGGPSAQACLWDVSRVPAGVYFLVLGDGDGQAVARFMVVH